jgi:hypothetical protein
VDVDGAGLCVKQDDGFVVDLFGLVASGHGLVVDGKGNADQAGKDGERQGDFHFLKLVLIIWPGSFGS